MFKLTDISAVLFVTTAINIVVSYISWRRSKTKGGIYFSLGIFGITLWTLAAALDYAAIPLDLKVFFATIEAIGYHSAFALFAWFSVLYAGNERWLEKKWVKALFLFIPLSNIILTVTNELHKSIWTGFVQKANNVVVFEHGPAFNWTVVTSYFLIIFIFVNLWMASRKGSDIARRQARILMLALLFPVATNLLYREGAGGIEGVDWTSVTFSISGLLFLWALYGQRFLDIVPIARDKLLDSFGDGMIVLDMQNRVIDINHVAARMFNISMIGENLIKYLPLAHSFLGNPPEQEIRTEIAIGEADKNYFDVLISPLHNEKKLVIGRLVIFRDVTERKQIRMTLERRTRELDERVKELNCLYGIAELVRTPDISLEEIFQGVVDLIPPAWQFSDRTCARITVEGQTFSTANFTETTWKQTSEIVLHDKQIGVLEVCYCGGQLVNDEYLFLEEEQLLLNAIAERIGRVVERRQAEMVLRQREADFREVFNETAHGIFIIDVLEDGNFRIGNSNKAEEIATSIRGENVRGKLLEDAFPPEVAQILHANYSRCIEAGTVIAYEEEINLSPAGGRYYHTTLAPVRDETGRFYRIIGSTLDITSRKRVEKMMMQQLHEIQELHQDLEQAQVQLVEQQRTLAAMEERQRIARNLHDSLSQSIHSLGLFSETLAAAIDRKDLERAKRILERVQESAQQSHKETRLLLYELQNPNTERVVNLAQSLEERLERVERHAGVKAQLIQEGSLEYCPQEWYENLFWITIEALNNALKHAFARKVQVRLHCSSQHMELEVNDDGRGFDVSEVNTGGLGLDNLRTRAGLIGGELTIESQSDKGTTVRFSADIPVSK